MYRDFHKLRKFCDKILLEEYERRYEQFEKGQGKKSFHNIVDCMCQHNYKCKKNTNMKDIISNDMITGNIKLLGSAAIDTTLNTSTTGIMHMAQNYQSYLTKIRLGGLKNYKEMESNKTLDLVNKELLR